MVGLKYYAERITIHMKNRILAFLLATVMLITFALPVSAQDIVNITDYGEGIDGTITLDNLDAGWYVISEVRAPSGYVPDYTPREIEVVPGETAVITINNNRDPSLTIRKIDEQTLAGIEGVTLRITKEGAAEYRDVVTGKDGIVIIPLSPGWYSVQERVAKPGYLLDDTVHAIELKEGKDSEITITNRKKPSLKLVKLCSVTKNPLQASFEIKVKNGHSLCKGDYRSFHASGRVGAGNQAKDA